MKENIYEFLKNYYELENDEREKMISDSRKINALSKKVVYSLHRDDLANAENFLNEIENNISLFLENYSKTKHLYSGSYKVAIQEYVEAMAYYYFVKQNEIYVPENNEILKEPDYYVLGLCDLSGELVRKALNEGINENFDEVFKIQKFISNLFNELAQIDFRNGEIRKKVDGLRWDLRKIEEMAFSLKIKKD